jgi:hypothetical protein
VRVAGQPHFARFGHRHDALEKVDDPFPEVVGVDPAGNGHHLVVGRLVVPEGGEHRAAASALRFGAWNAEDVEVVLRGADAEFAERLDQAADTVDLLVTLARQTQDDPRRLMLVPDA